MGSVFSDSSFTTQNRSQTEVMLKSRLPIANKEAK